MIIIPSITKRRINLKFKIPSYTQIILNNLEIECVLWESEIKIKYIKMCHQGENQLRPILFFLKMVLISAKQPT